MIDWEKESISKLVFTPALTSTQLHALIEKPFCAPKFSLHTQSCEGAVQGVAEAAKVCGRGMPAKLENYETIKI